MVTDQEASKALDQIKGTQSAIKQKSTKEYAPWIGWGLFIVLFFPGFDYIKPEIWGVITWIVAIAGWLITFLYFLRGATKIKTIKKSPRYDWVIYILWIAIGTTFAAILDLGSQFQYAWTVAGLAVGLPFIAYGLKLKGRE